MKQTPFYHRVTGIFPALSTLLFILVPIAVVPDHLQTITPVLFFHAVFFWLIFAPAFLPLWCLFFYGLLIDTLIGAPLGFYSLSGLILSYCVYRQQRFLVKLAFPGLWLRFAFFLSIVSLLIYLGMALYHQHWFDGSTAIVQWLLSILLYPAIHWCLYRVLALMPDNHD